MYVCVHVSVCVCVCVKESEETGTHSMKVNKHVNRMFTA